jgi:hypothetical protein
MGNNAINFKSRQEYFIPCPKCDGNARLFDNVCPRCFGYGMIPVRECKYCGADVVWLRARSGRFVLVDAETTKDITLPVFDSARMIPHSYRCSGRNKK